MGLTRRHLFGILTGAAAYALAPEPLRRYFIIGQPERRFVPFDVMAASTLRMYSPTTAELLWSWQKSVAAVGGYLVVPKFPDHRRAVRLASA